MAYISMRQLCAATSCMQIINDNPLGSMEIIDKMEEVGLRWKYSDSHSVPGEYTEHHVFTNDQFNLGILHSFNGLTNKCQLTVPAE